MSQPNVAGNILQILASLPEFLRKPILRNRLSEFFSLSEFEKKEIVINALKAAPETDFDILSNLIKTWMEILSEFDEEKRKTMFSVYVDVIAASPTLASKLNAEAIVSLFNSIPDEKREILSATLRNLLSSLPNEMVMKFINALPVAAKSTLRL